MKGGGGLFAPFPDNWEWLAELTASRQPHRHIASSLKPRAAPHLRMAVRGGGSMKSKPNTSSMPMACHVCVGGVTFMIRGASGWVGWCVGVVV